MSGLLFKYRREGFQLPSPGGLRPARGLPVVGMLVCFVQYVTALPEKAAAPSEARG